MNAYLQAYIIVIRLRNCLTIVRRLKERETWSNSPRNRRGLEAASYKFVPIQFPALYRKLNLMSRRNVRLLSLEFESAEITRIISLFPHSFQVCVRARAHTHTHTHTHTYIYIYIRIVRCVVSPDESGVRGGAGGSRRGARGGRRVGLLHVHHRSYR